MVVTDEKDAAEKAEVLLGPGNNILKHGLLYFLFEITYQLLLRKENIISQKNIKEYNESKQTKSIRERNDLLS